MNGFKSMSPTGTKKNMSDTSTLALACSGSPELLTGNEV